MSDRKHSVVITGLGPLTPIGTGKESFWNAALEGRSGIQALHTQWDREDIFRSRVTGSVETPEPEACRLTKKEAELIDPAARFALAGAALALEDAGLSSRQVGDRKNRYEIEGVDPCRAGVILGSGIGGLCTLEQSHRRYVQGEPLNGKTRYALPMLIPNALPAQVAIKYGLHGECKVVSTACASGTMATGDAYRLIRDGELDMAISGGVDKTSSTVDGYGMMGFDLLKTLSTRNDDPARASRPFDKDRDGFVLGEGAGILILEREEHARARGAHIYARIAGYASVCEAHSMMQLQTSGEFMASCMRKAIESSGLSVDDFVYVNAHGTSTRMNDATEAIALRKLFGSRIYDVLVNSTKAMTGHGIGAAGGIEAITTALSLARGMVHRCVNLFNPDPACDLALPRENRPIRPTAALSNSFGFGGHNATLVLQAV